jgi:hypothetical protein
MSIGRAIELSCVNICCPLRKENELEGNSEVGRAAHGPRK